MARSDQPVRRLMLLGLSTDTAPGAHPTELAAACGARGLAGFEIRLATHPAVAIEELRAACDASDVRLFGLLAESDHHSEAAALLSRGTGAPVIVATADTSDADRIGHAGDIEHAGGYALPLLSGPVEGWIQTVHELALPFAWQIDDRSLDPAADIDRILDRGAALRYIRLAGGGPETAMHEGRGIGPLMGRLTLSGYQGPLVMTPSSSSYHVAWSSWLGRRGGWGCGSTHRHAPLPLQKTTTLPSHNAGAA